MDASQLGAYLPLVLVAVLIYLLFIRPGRRRAQATSALQASLSTGDEVMLSSGIFATVVEINDEVAKVELGPGMVVRVHRGAVTQIIKDKPSPFADDDDVPGSAGRPPGDDDDAGVS